MANPKYAGRSSSAYRKIRRTLMLARNPCYHCGQVIDYDLKWPDPGSFSVDHLEARSRNPELADDPANCVAAHLRCNQSKGAGAMSLSLGNRSEDF